MAGSILEFGFRIPVVVKSDGTVVDGHLRLKAAQKLRLDTVPVVIADELTDAQVKAFRILANQSTAWASWDEDLLICEIEDLKIAGFDLELTGFEISKIEEMLSGPKEIQLDDKQHERSDSDVNLCHCPKCGFQFSL